jgi:UDP-galactopyranose mutase
MPVSQTVICFSHLRWNFVYQRPQHLLSRCAQTHAVIFFEEPLYDADTPELEQSTVDGLTVAVPHLAPGMPDDLACLAQRRMLDRLVRTCRSTPVLWYYTPMARACSAHVNARAIVYDCMDELSLFKNPPAGLTDRERELFRVADVVFTGGQSLYEHKRRTQHHRNIHAFPSSVDVPHFARARLQLADPPDQAAIPHPRVGFFGVVDERMDYGLLSTLAAARPDLHFVMVGPVVKVDPAALPKAPNIHWLGAKKYDQLPGYLAGWDVAMLPFARNESTRFISPTKTPEYLAAGRPVVSTAITDVVRPYGERGLVWIADRADAMSAAIDAALASEPVARMARADAFLADLSWDRTWKEMWQHVEMAIAHRARPRHSAAATVPAASRRPAAATETRRVVGG